MLFIDLEVIFVWYSCFNVGIEGEILDILIFDGCILLYSDTVDNKIFGFWLRF